MTETSGYSQLKNKSFFTHRSAQQLDRKTQFINSASQILKSPNEKEDVFDQIYKKLSSSSKSYLNLQKEQNPTKNSFIVDEENKQQNDEVMGDKWKENIRIDQSDTQENTFLLKRYQTKRNTQSIDIPNNQSSQQLLQSFDSTPSLKTLIAEKVSAQIKDTLFFEEQKELEKQEKLREKVFSKQVAVIDHKQYASPVPVKEQGLQDLQYKRPGWRFIKKITSQLDIDEENEPKKFKTENNDVKIDSLSNIELDDEVEQTLNTELNHKKETLIESLSRAGSVRLKIKFTKSMIQPNIQQNTSNGVQVNLNEEWNFKNKIFLDAKSLRKASYDQNTQSVFMTPDPHSPRDLPKSEQRLQSAVKRSALRIGEYKKKNVSFNDVAYVLLQSGQQIEEIVTDKYRAKKLKSSSSRKIESNDLFKYWNF